MISIDHHKMLSLLMISSIEDFYKQGFLFLINNLRTASICMIHEFDFTIGR